MSSVDGWHTHTHSRRGTPSRTTATHKKARQASVGGSSTDGKEPPSNAPWCYPLWAIQQQSPTREATVAQQRRAQNKAAAAGPDSWRKWHRDDKGPQAHPYLSAHHGRKEKQEKQGPPWAKAAGPLWTGPTKLRAKKNNCGSNRAK